MRSVRSARGLQGRQELELLTPGARRMLVCRLYLASRRSLEGNFCAKRANEAGVLVCSEQLREQLHAQVREQLHAQVREQLHAQLHQWSRCMK